MTDTQLSPQAQAARAALLVHAELVGDAHGGELDTSTSERAQLVALLTNARRLADERGIGWDALLVLANAAREDEELDGFERACAVDRAIELHDAETASAQR